MRPFDPTGRETDEALCGDMDIVSQVLDLTSARIGYYDLDGRFLYASPALARLSLMTPQQMLGHTLREIGVPADIVEPLDAIRRKVLDSGVAANEVMTVEYGATVQHSQVSCQPAFGRGGEIAGTVITAWDVTDITKAGRKIARLDRVYAILSGINEVIVRVRDRDELLRQACRIAAELGGFRLAWIGIVDPATDKVMVAAYAGPDSGPFGAHVAASNMEAPGKGDVGLAQRENRTVVVDALTEPSLEASRADLAALGYRAMAGFPIRLGSRAIGVFALTSTQPDYFDTAETHLFEQLAGDISFALESLESERARAAAEAALRESERRYRDLFDKSPQCMWVFETGSLRFLAVNDAAVHAYGYSRDEFLAMTIRDIRPPEDLPSLLDDLASAGEGYRPARVWRHIRKNGSTIFVEVSAHDIDYDGKLARLVLAVDVTERRRLEMQLSEAARLEAMGHLAGGIAHDFNNLLTAVNGYADILTRELADPEHIEAAQEIKRAGSRAAELTRQVLAFARRQAMVPRPVDLNQVVAGVTQMLRRLIGEQISLCTSLDPSPAVVQADAGQLEQVLVNLAINAQDAMQDGGKMEIAVKAVADAAVFGRDMSGPAVLLTVSDNGAGMDEATLAHAFEPFFTTKGPGRGTGLGLATAYGIVRQSNGEIWATSSVGVGTTFFVLLPQTDAAPERVKVPPASLPHVDGHATILVVEDDQAVRGFVVSTLERAGYRVLVAASPAQAIALAEGFDEQIDLLLTDVVMPGSTGQVLAERLSALRPCLRVVLMSGYSAVMAEGPTDPRFWFIAKPFERDELKAIIVRALES